MNVFAYGILAYEELLSALTGKEFQVEWVILEGFRRYSVVKEGYARFPAVKMDETTSVEGVLVRDVDDDSLRLLDEFEEVASGLYERKLEEVRLESGELEEAWVYVAGSESIHCLAGSWDREEFKDQYFEEYRSRIIPEFLRDQERKPR